MSKREPDKCYFEDSRCDSETDKAIHVTTGEGDVLWIPKSVVDDDSEVYRKGDKGLLVLPEWFCLKEELI